jgi:hypothetical protein
LKERFVHPQSFRSEDKSILDEAVALARQENSNLTQIIRDALKFYLHSKMIKGTSERKLDEYLEDGVNPKSSNLSIYRVFKPAELATWSDQDLVLFARLLRSRRDEVDSALRKRKYFFKW